MNRNTKAKDPRSLVEKTQRRLLAIRNIRFARRNWGISPEQVAMLKSVTEELQLSVGAGDLRLLDGNWYVTHAGLLRIAQRSHCSGMRTTVDKGLSDPASCRWVFKATVYTSPRSKGFVGFGDADPSNVSSIVHGAEMRVAETRAVNRALRKAYGIGLCSVEELGWVPRSISPERPVQPATSSNGNNGHHSSQPRLRDRLCMLIRQHKLDAGLVKAYAADYCRTTVLRDANRDQVEDFINKLAESAAKDREALIAQLNSYSKRTEVSS
ncbi:MAG: hypothetical protein WBF06_05320 [Candidatus Acidiferrales bacterium]